MKYVTADEIRKIDNLAQTKFKIPSLVLMENAGRAASDEILKYIKKNPVDKIAVFCGKGNNGGDGFVVARYLVLKNIKADIYLIGKASEIKKPDPLINLKSAKDLGVGIIELPDIESLEKIKNNFKYGLIVDAIFGTGFNGKLPDHIIKIIDFLNKREIPIFAVDIPSGLDATTGEVETPQWGVSTCIKAAKTITFGLPKTGFIKADGPEYTGEVSVRNISYPASLLR